MTVSPWHSLPGMDSEGHEVIGGNDALDLHEALADLANLALIRCHPSRPIIP